MFCNADKCTSLCPAYVYNHDDSRTQCRLINAQLEAEEARKKAYQSMMVKLENIPEC